MSTFLQDLRYSLRQFANNPGVSLTAILSLSPPAQALHEPGRSQQGHDKDRYCNPLIIHSRPPMTASVAVRFATAVENCELGVLSSDH
jgi:hypothetical protein